MIWIPKQSPSSDPKFHNVVILDGVGKSIKELLIILITGDVFRNGISISFVVVKGHVKNL